MQDLLSRLLDLLRGHPWLFVPLVLLAFAAVMILPPVLFLLLARTADRKYRAARRRAAWVTPVSLIALAAGVLAGVHLWSVRTAEPLLIYSEGPLPRAIQRIAYDLTVEPNGGLLVREEIAMTLDRDPRSLFRPLRRDRPATVLSLTDNGRPVAARVWVGPQYGIRLGTGTPAGAHTYVLTYRLAGAARPGTKDPERICPPFSTCIYLTDQREPLPDQEVRWRPITWAAPGAEQVFTWHFPGPYLLAQLQTLNGRYTWTGAKPVQLDEHTLQFSVAPGSYGKAPSWAGELNLPAGMTEARRVEGAIGPSLPVFLIPLLALAGVLAVRMRIGGTPAGRATLKAEYIPPDGLSAAQLGRLAGSPRQALTAAAIADAAHRGVLRVEALHHDVPLLPDRYDDEFVRTGPSAALPEPERRFVDGLLHGQARMRLSQLAGHTSDQAAKLESSLHRSLVDGGYLSGRRELLRALGVLLALVVLAGGPYATFFLGNHLPWLLPVRGHDAATMARFTEPALAAWVLAALVVALYALTIPTITHKGALARSRARGFAEYLRTAELGPIEHEAAEGRASRWLPHALALGLTSGLVERWCGLVEPAGDDDCGKRRESFDRARFGDEGVERRTLLAGPAPVSAHSVDGGMSR